MLLVVMTYAQNKCDAFRQQELEQGLLQEVVVVAVLVVAV